LVGQVGVKGGERRTQQYLDAMPSQK